MRYNSHTVKFTLLNHAIQWFFRKFIESCNHRHNPVIEHFYHPNKIPDVCLQFILSLPQALGNYQSTFCLYRFAYFGRSSEPSFFYLAWSFVNSSVEMHRLPIYPTVQGFPDVPVVTTPPFQCWGLGLDPWLGSQDPTGCRVQQRKKEVYSSIACNICRDVQRWFENISITPERNAFVTSKFSYPPTLGKY